MRHDKSMLTVAYEIIDSNKKPITFGELVDEIAEILEMTEAEKKARLGEFYTDLSLDGRFVALTDNTWDLRKHHVYEKVHIDFSDVYSEDEGENELDPEEKETEIDEDSIKDETSDDDDEEEDEVDEKTKKEALKAAGLDKEL